MQKDPRYKAVKRLIESGDITEFSEIFEQIPKSIVAADLGLAVDRFTVKMNRLEKFRVQELLLLAKKIDLDFIVLVTIVYNQYKKKGAAILPSTKKNKK